jgi:Flp pilus assembly protein TadD
MRIARRLFIRRRRVRPSWMPRRPSRLQRVIERLKSHGNLRLVAGAILIVALVLVIYLPILPGSFIMDDERLVKDGNPIFTGELTPRSVWFQTDFPLTLCTWWAQWLMWGNNPGGYHAVNIALQAVSALLLWRVLARLKIPGAWLAGAIFAVHPVCVGSVARIAELKNTLSLPFFLASFWAYLRYESSSLYPADEKPGSDPRSERQATWWFAFSFVAFVLALLSKTTTIMLPLALLGCAAWQRGRIARRDLLHTAPYFILALSFGLMSVWFQKYQALAGENLAPESFAERVATAGRNFWFYCGKAVLPVNLTVFYSRWRTDLPLLEAWLPSLLMAALCLVCWRFRRTWGQHALFGVGCFAILLFPALGFFDAQCFTKFQVSDHLQYLPLIAFVSLGAGVMASLLRKTPFQSIAAALLLTLSVLAFKRAQVFATQEGLLRDTLAKNSAAWPVCNDLGVILVNHRQFPEAAEYFKAALKFQPNNPDLLANLAMTYFALGRPAEACVEYRAAVKIKPSSPRLHEGLSRALEQLGNNAAAIAHLKIALRMTSKTETRMNLADLLYEAHDYHQAVDQYRLLLSLNPNNTTGLNNLAYILANCPDKTVRDGAAAVELAERACQLTGYKEIPFISTLAAAYREAGRPNEASATADMASRIQLAISEGEPWPQTPNANRF